MVDTDTTRGTLHIRKKLDGVTRNVLHLREDVFAASAPTCKKTDISDIGDANADTAGDNSQEF